MNDNYPILIQTRNLSMFLHNYVYTNNQMINKLKEYIGLQFDLFNINYIDMEKKFEIRIKKTNIKKMQNYSHTATFYYDMIDSVFVRFFRDPEVIGYINNTLKSDNSIDMYQYDELQNTLQTILMNGKEVSLIYSVTPIPDNSIFINL